MENVNVIVAAGRDGAIGRGGDLLWHIPADLRRFKQLTMGHPIIMGRKTWESLPKKPLPGRLNIVLTRNAHYEAPGAKVVSSPQEALAVAREAHPEVNSVADTQTPFVIGGAQIYNLFMPLAKRVYLTEVDAVFPDADAFLPFPLDREVWEVEEQEDTATTPDGLAYRYVNYIRK